MPESPQSPSRLPPAPPTCVTTGAAPYAELVVTSNFSFLRGASHPDELVYQAAELGYRAIAITDHHTLAGAVRAHAAAKRCGMKLIVGARIPLMDGPELIAWAPDRAAYARLCRLLTRGKRRAEKGKCELKMADFLGENEGLLVGVEAERHEGTRARRHEGEERKRRPMRLVPSCLRASVPSWLSDSVASSLDTLREALGDRLSLVVSRSYGGDDESHLRRMIELGRGFDIPLLATNNVHYHDPGRRELQDVLTCIRHGCTVGEAGFRLFSNGERYLKPPEQVHRLFFEHPKAIQRGLEICDRCDFQLDSLKYEYPDELVPAGYTALEFLVELTWKGAAKRYSDGIPEKVRQIILHEFKLIEELHFEAYFLTVYDLVRFARERGILCQGRGSAANSAVCYCIGITSVDPAKVDLLFERFVSAARNEPPDIDVDFEHERREEVIQYVYEKYGRDRAGMCATLITYRGRSAVRDVGKAMGLPLDMVDSLAKRLDWWHAGKLTDDQLREAGLDPNDATVRKIVELTSELLGFPRHLGQHTGGMIMSRGLLCEMVPIENASMEDRTVVEWDKDDVEELGLLKMDVLALGMLTVISKGFGLLEESDELHTLPPEDPAVYDMICDADTIGVFQIESRAQMSMLPRLRPRNFYDLVIEVAIVRPGPIQGNMVHPYLRRRNGEEAVSYPSEELKSVLNKTLGVPLFQEQAMKLAMVAAGFSASEADQLRRAMAAWRRSGSINTFHQKIVVGMMKNGYTREFADQTFKQIQGFGEYGFPESHSASFALLVYASAWMKRYHPAVFCCALLNSQPMGFYAPAQIVRDAREHGVEVRGVDVNASNWDCTLEMRGFPPLPPGEGRGEGAFENQNVSVAEHPLTLTLSQRERGQDKRMWGANDPAVRLGFRQIKGFREQHAKQIVEARVRVGRFTSIEQFHHEARIPALTVRKLAEADAFTSLDLSRRHSVWESLTLRDEPAPLFPLRASVPSCLRASEFLPPMPLGQEVMTDYSTTSLSLKKHPLSLVRSILSKDKILTAAELNATEHGRWVKVAGLVLIRQRPGTASGIVFETLEDETGVVNLVIRPDIFEKYRPAARHAGLLQCDGYIERQGQVVHVMAKRLFDRSDLLAGFEMSSRDFH